MGIRNTPEALAFDCSDLFQSDDDEHLIFLLLLSPRKDKSTNKEGIGHEDRNTVIAQTFCSHKFKECIRNGVLGKLNILFLRG